MSHGTPSLTEEQVVAALISHYKTNGLNMAGLLDNPLFEKLPPGQKVRLVRDYAKELNEGTTHDFDKVDYSRIASNALFDGVGGAITGYTAGGIYSMLHGQKPYRTAALTGAVMGITGALAGGVKALSDRDAKKAVKERMEILVNNPTDANAVGAISAMHESSKSRGLKDAILGRIGDMMRNSAASSTFPRNHPLEQNNLVSLYNMKLIREKFPGVSDDVVLSQLAQQIH